MRAWNDVIAMMAIMVMHGDPQHLHLLHQQDPSTTTAPPTAQTIPLPQ
jgi:hypothetical protein